MKIIKSIVALGLCISVSACVTAGQRERANVFSASDVNKRQETKLVEIINIETGKVEVDNKSEQQAAAFAGAVFGALLGAAAGRNSTYRGSAAIGGAGAGAAFGSMAAGTTKLVDGVNLTYIENQQALSSVQVGKMCEFALGPALVVITEANETRVQPNSATPCQRGSEQVLGAYSKLGASGAYGVLSNTQTGHLDTVSDLKRQQEVMRQKASLQRETVGLQRETTSLKKEERRTETADERADLELDAAKASIDTIRATNDAIRGAGKGMEKGTDINVIK